MQKSTVHNVESLQCHVAMQRFVQENQEISLCFLGSVFLFMPAMLTSSMACL